MAKPRRGTTTTSSLTFQHRQADAEHGWDPQPRPVKTSGAPEADRDNAVSRTAAVEPIRTPSRPAAAQATIVADGRDRLMVWVAGRGVGRSGRQAARHRQAGTHSEWCWRCRLSPQENQGGQICSRKGTHLNHGHDRSDDQEKMLFTRKGTTSCTVQTFSVRLASASGSTARGAHWLDGVEFRWIGRMIRFAARFWVSWRELPCCPPALAVPGPGMSCQKPGIIKPCEHPSCILA